LIGSFIFEEKSDICLGACHVGDGDPGKFAKLKLNMKRGDRLGIKLVKIHHIAIICSDYEKSKDFYVRLLGLTPISEVYRVERDSYKLDLEVNGHYQIELFSFPDPASRPSYPEAAGLRHLAFAVEHIEESVAYLTSERVIVEAIRVDPFSEKKYTFFSDPDGLPIELYEV
jgi:glyoxylase I family protein